MNINISLVKKMGLTDNEIALLRIFKSEKTRLSISECSRLTDIPRTTLYTTITSLSGRGLIETNTSGRKRILSINAEILYEDNLHLNKPRVSGSEGIGIVHGIDRIIEELKALTSHKNSRIYIIQSRESLKTIADKFDSTIFTDINIAIKSNKVIVESLIQEGTLNDYLQSNKHRDGEISDEFLNRMNDTSYIPNKWFKADTDLIYSDQVAYIINWQKEVSVKIQNKSMIVFLKSVFEIVKMHGRKIDINQLVRSV